MTKTVNVRCEVTFPFSYNQETVKQYLEEHGWTKIGPWGPYGVEYVKSSTPHKRYVILITNEEVADLPQRLPELVREIAQDEERSPLDVIRDLERWGSD